MVTQITQNQTDLMKELGLDNLPEDKQDELVIKMTEVILKRMFVETMGRLNVSDQEKLGEMMESQATPEQIENFLKEKIADYDAMLAGIVEKFKEEMKNMQA